jgi:hypothetical protein
VKRALGRVPRQGAKHPFKLYQNYLKDIRVLRFGRVDDGFLQFGKPVKQVDKPVPEQSAQAEL